MLPTLPHKEQTMPYERDSTETIAIPDNNIQILVIENNQIISDYLKTVLRKNLNPCTITIAFNLKEGISSLQYNFYHLILTDTTLELKGEEVCQAIRQVNIWTPLIMMAVSEIKVTNEYIMGWGADGIVYKPIEVKSLIKQIEDVLAIDVTKRGTSSGMYNTLEE